MKTLISIGLTFVLALFVSGMIGIGIDLYKENVLEPRYRAALMKVCKDDYVFILKRNIDITSDFYYHKCGKTVYVLDRNTLKVEKYR